MTEYELQRGGVMTVVDVYRREGTDDIELEEDETERRACAVRLGFERQANRQPEDAGRFYHELTGEALGIWREFLPKIYHRRSDGKQSDWKNYRFDLIPADVMREIEWAAQLDVFDDFQIWTPEGFGQLDALQVARFDPMAVGVVNDVNDRPRYFPIVRWGESQLLPFARIRELVQTQRERTQIRRQQQSYIDRCRPWLSAFRFALCLAAILSWMVAIGYNGAISTKVIWGIVAAAWYIAFVMTGRLRQSLATKARQLYPLPDLPDFAAV